MNDYPELHSRSLECQLRRVDWVREIPFSFFRPQRCAFIAFIGADDPKLAAKVSLRVYTAAVRQDLLQAMQQAMLTLEKLTHYVEVNKSAVQRFFESLDQAFRCFTGLAEFQPVSEASLRGIEKAVRRSAAGQRRLYTGLQPAIAYAQAGYPYGRTRAGKKRWLREVKQKSL